MIGDAVLSGSKHHDERTLRSAVGTERSDVIVMHRYAGSLLEALMPEFIISIMHAPFTRSTSYRFRSHAAEAQRRIVK